MRPKPRFPRKKQQPFIIRLMNKNIYTKTVSAALFIALALLSFEFLTGQKTPTPVPAPDTPAKNVKSAKKSARPAAKTASEKGGSFRIAAKPAGKTLNKKKTSQSPKTAKPDAPPVKKPDPAVSEEKTSAPGPDKSEPAEANKTMAAPGAVDTPKITGGIIRKGDMASFILQDYLSEAEIRLVTAACEPKFPLSKMPAGMPYAIVQSKNGDFLRFEFQINPLKRMVVSKTGPRFTAQIENTEQID